MLHFLNIFRTGLYWARFLYRPPLLKVKLISSIVLCSGMLLLPTGLSLGQSSGLEKIAKSGLSSNLNRVQTLIKANVLDLAQSILESQGPPVLPTTDWQQWEYQLWALYRTRNDWNALLQRVAQVPPAFPDLVRQEADRQSVIALIELQRGKEARAILRRYLLENGMPETEKRGFRKQIVETYLIDGLFDEAATAMQQFQLDYRSQAEDWLLLSSQVYMQLDNPDKAISLLAPLDSLKARLLRVYARIQNDSINAKQALQKMAEILEQYGGSKNYSNMKEHEIIAVNIFIKQKYEDVSVIDDLERYMILTNATTLIPDATYPQFEIEDLLLGYTRIALNTVNESNLSIGEYADLFEFVIQLPANQVVAKKSISGYLLQQIIDPELRYQISNFYVNSLIDSGQVRIIPLLFGHNKPFQTLKLSGEVGLLLSNKAIALGDISLAAFVNESLTEIPPEMDRFDWILHVARIAIIAGQYEQGKQTLDQWINAFPVMDSDRIDQVLQPIFDLQTVHQHTYALELLLKLQNRITTAKYEREVSYWIAESFQATRQYIKAADYFLYSALLKDNGFDQWGESARFRAAESLQSANLLTDARLIFEALYSRAQEEGRKSQLQQHIQELWLLESGLGKTDVPIDSLPVF